MSAERRWLVDGLNVIGSRPDGWWRDRRGAMRSFVDEVAAWADGRDVTVVFDGPKFELHSDDVNVAFASRAGADAADDEIVHRLREDPEPGGVIVATSDRGLAERVQELGGQVVSALSFRRLIAGHATD